MIFFFRIPCPCCSDPFTKAKPPMQHLKEHKTEHEKLCNKCLQMFQGSQLKEHIEKFNVHGHKVGLTCEVCSRKFNVKSRLRDHQATKHGYKDLSQVCDKCGRTYNSLSGFKHHLKQHLGKKNICRYCQLCFASPHKLRKHVKTHLNLQSEYICDYCGKSFTVKNSLKSHIAKCHTSCVNQESFKCQYCDKTFTRKQYRKTHEYWHTGNRTYPCQKCPLTFTNWGNCNKHMIRRHGVTIAKTRRTTAGRLRVNETGEVVEVKKDVQKWMHDVTSQGPCTKSK